MSKEDVHGRSQTVFTNDNRLIKHLSRVYDVCLWWSLFPSLYAASAVTATSLLLSAFSLEVVGIACVVTFAIYNMNNIYDSSEDLVNAHRKAVFVRDHRREILGLVVVAYVVGFSVSFLGGPYAPVVTLLPLLAGIVYSIDSIRAKETVVVNTVIVSMALALPVVGLPLAFQHRLPVVPSLLLFVCFLLKYTVSVELCNITDITGDRAAGVSTLPVVFGVRRTKIILYVLEIGAFALIPAGIVLSFVSVEALLVFGPTALYSFGCIYITEQEPPISKPAVYGDFQFVLMGLFALVVL
jgi:4-hydroxybenzoate polyprenyltransferase